MRSLVLRPRLVLAIALLCTALAHEVHGQAFVNWESPQVNPLALTPSGATLLAANTADNRLEVFDASGGALVHARSISVGLDPVSVRARTETEVWVVNHISDSISIVDLPSGRVMRTIATGDEPCDVVFTGNPVRAFVSVSQLNQLRVFDPNNLNAPPIIINIQGEDPRALAVSADGTRVYAAIFESGNKSSIIARQAVSNPASPYGGANPPPNVGNAFSPAIAANLPAPPPVSQIVKQNAGGQWMDGNNRNWSQFVTWGVHDHDVAIIDTTSLNVTHASGLMNMVAGLSVAPSGVVTAVGTDALNQIRFEPNVNSIFVRCEIAWFNPATPASITIADINPHLDYASVTIPQAQRDFSIGDPRCIVWHPSGAKAYVSGMGSNNVIVTNTSGARLAQINVGKGPTGLAINPSGTRVYALNRFDGSISTIDATSDTETARVSFFDPTPSTITLGRRFLYETHLTSGLGQASCASCHIDGRTDHLGWDLGNPAGAMIAFNAVCQAPLGGCIDWHPMKGPMVTQTLQGIIGNEPFHWRGEKTDLADFNAAYTDLQGRPTQITAQEMAQLTSFVASIMNPPNPNRNLDNTLRTALPVTGGNGNANNGRQLFLTAPLLIGNLTCVGCHALPDGTNNRVDLPGVDPQGRKNAQLRNMLEKTGFDRASQNNNRGFGFNHDGTIDGIFNLLSGPGFTFPPGAAGQQQRRDVEAFVLSLSLDTHAGVGAQTTVIDGAAVPPAQQTLINTFINLANTNAVGLVVKGRQGLHERGYRFAGGAFQSDHAGEMYSPAALLALATNGTELTYTIVPAGSQTRIGIDRDSDSFLDGDERALCSNPADPSSTPLNACRGDIAPVGNVNHAVDVDDLLAVITAWGTSAPYADIAPTCEGDGNVNVDDMLAVIVAWGPCP